MTAPVATRPAGGKQAPAPVLRPFRIGVQNTDEHVYDNTTSTGAAVADLPTYSLNAYQSIEFDDVNNKPIVGPFDGWEFSQLDKLGGYAFQDDVKASPRFSAITGGGATGGSWEFILRVPVQLVPRDALGSLPNKSNTSTYKLRMRLNNTASIYGVAPTAAPSVRTRVQPCSWWEPDERDLKGRMYQQQPPAVTTTQYWVRNDYVINPGAISPSLDAVGFPIRNIIFGLEDGAGSRSVGETDFMNPFQLQVEANILVDRFKEVWQHRIAQAYDYTGATFDASEAHDNGVYVEPYCNDFCHKPGWETRYGYLETASGTRLQVKGTLGGAGAHTLRVWTNYVAPANGDVFALTGR